MHVARKLVDHFLEPAEQIHLRADNAGGVAITSAGKAATRRRAVPLEGFCVEAEQDITDLARRVRIMLRANFQHCITVTHHLIVAATKNVHFTLVCNCRMACKGTIVVALAETFKNRNRKMKLKVFFWSGRSYAKRVFAFAIRKKNLSPDSCDISTNCSQL